MEKLVRDHIPEIIRAAGGNPSVRTASSGERLLLLLAKLQEEVSELEADGTLDELVDVLEVVRAIQIELGASDQELEILRAEKAAKRGAFCNGTVLLLGPAQ